MYVYRGGCLRRIPRRPANADMLVCFSNYRFISEREPWDADDWEAIARGTGLYDISSEAGLHESDRWRKTYTDAYFQGGGPIKAVQYADRVLKIDRFI